MENTENSNPLQVSDFMNMFASAGSGGDEEILKIASEYALQIGPQQIATLMRLKLFARDYAKYNSELPDKINYFVREYLHIKKYHESGGFIQRIIADLSLKKIVPNDAVKVNVMKQWYDISPM